MDRLDLGAADNSKKGEQLMKDFVAGCTITGSNRNVKVRYDKYDDAYIMVKGKKMFLYEFLKTQQPELKNWGIDGIAGICAGLAVGIKLVDSENVKVYWLQS